MLTAIVTLQEAEEAYLGAPNENRVLCERLPAWRIGTRQGRSQFFRTCAIGFTATPAKLLGRTTGGFVTPELLRQQTFRFLV